MVEALQTDSSKFTLDIDEYAKGLGIKPHCEYKPDQAAKLIGVGVNSLRSAAKNGELSFLRLGERRITFIGVDLIQWKLAKHTKLESTTSPKTVMATGAKLGMTQKPSKENLQALALETLRKRKKS
ncbi:helix-turn-helix domain-containing protein [Marinibactrum halimedae]|uniref:Uncharacterized protein n=1 Tax=Marinibactrum halimedae TaxID=1444977 RepID=A0AA37WQ76_9GAMM|nr:helix-turn-helix domain-containing protein [Marinibactrum halimedae]MCD9458924.1 helix-turn-helix domain-containing protein [Marinibactrum halimedae]GLS27771.1 hypothetical protein GCM10007877_34900 [Marinibactrum halimedae]